MPAELLSADVAVRLPASVQKQADAAAAAHKQAYQTEPPASDPPAGDQPAVTAPVTDPPVQPVAQPQRTIPDSGEPGSWEHRYHAMKGRYDQSQTSLGQTQEQLSQMGDELQRATGALERQPTQPATPRPAHVRLTSDDVQTYGAELIDMIQRAAVDAVQPQIGQVQQGVKQVAQRIQQTSTIGMYQRLDAEVPTWRDVNNDPRFRTWCGLPDIYSGVIRGRLLDAAFKAADAPRVIAFFKGFLAEEVATGQLPDPNRTEPPVVPHAPAVRLDMLTAPGRAKPASGASQVPAEKPVFTRAQISWFYSQAGRQYYTGREDERKATEREIFDAQKDGRVRG